MTKFALQHHFLHICSGYDTKNFPQSAGFEPARAEPNRFLVCRLNHSAPLGGHWRPSEDTGVLWSLAKFSCRTLLVQFHSMSDCSVLLFMSDFGFATPFYEYPYFGGTPVSSRVAGVLF